MDHRIGLEAYPGTVLAWVLTLPGCITSAADEAAVAKAIPLAIAEHTAWLREHGQQIDEADTWEVAERLDGSTGDIIFTAEAQGLTTAELEQLIERARFARSDFLAAIAGLPPEVMDWLPPVDAFGHFDPWAPDVRSIRSVVAHVLSFEAYYRDGLHDGPAAGVFETVPISDAEPAHQKTVGALRTLAPADRARRFHPTRPGVPSPETWTVRKVFRRLISHERAHTLEIIERRGWAAFGAPKL